MNESSLLINSPFALKQQNNVPVYVEFGDKIERPYTDSEIKESLRRQMIRDKKAGLFKDEIVLPLRSPAAAGSFTLNLTSSGIQALFRE